MTRQMITHSRGWHVPHEVQGSDGQHGQGLASWQISKDLIPEVVHNVVVQSIPMGYTVPSIPSPQQHPHLCNFPLHRFPVMFCVCKHYTKGLTLLTPFC